jgi:5-methylcytosine-specific restriction endonuclease McrA
MWRHGDPTAGATSPRPGATCDVTGCAEPHYALRLCGRHWRRAYRPVKSKQRREAPGTASIAQIEARLAYWGWKCWNCRRPYEQIDHVKPIAKGGSNWPANLRPACQSCNARKRSRWFGVVRLNELIREVA